MRIRTNGIELNYAVEGEGPWVVMSHSLACAIPMWDEQARALRGRYRVLRFDTRGHGGSDAPDGPYTLAQLADDLHGLLVRLEVAQSHFVGLSMGGMIGMTYALKHPGALRSLVLCDTSSRVGPEARPMWEERIRIATEQGMEPLVEPTLKRWFTEPFLARRPPAVERVAGMIRSTPVAGYAGCCHAIPQIDVTDRLRGIACPVQVIVGEQDVGTPVAMARAIHDAIAGSELVVIPNASHLSNVEQPEAFNRALLDFLGRAGTS
jgi:3-oxoadipate enol-lactonase